MRKMGHYYDLEMEDAVRRVPAHNAQWPADIVGDNTKARNQGSFNREPLGRAVVGFSTRFYQCTPPVAGNCWQGFQTHAIAYVSLLKIIVSQLREKGKAHNDVPQLQHHLQEIRETPQWASTISL